MKVITTGTKVSHPTFGQGVVVFDPMFAEEYRKNGTRQGVLERVKFNNGQVIDVCRINLTIEQ